MEKQFLQRMIERLRAGHDSVRTTLWQEYGPQVVTMVRRYLRPGTAPSPLQRRIHTAFAEVASGNPYRFAGDRDTLLRLTARRFCESLMDPVGLEDLAGLPHRETVCA